MCQVKTIQSKINVLKARLNQLNDSSIFSTEDAKKHTQQWSEELKKLEDELLTENAKNIEVNVEPKTTIL